MMTDRTAYCPPDFDELVETLDFLDDWEDRYRYLIDLGRAMPSLPDAAYSAENKVEGCMSQVWLVCIPDNNHPPHLHFAADSDALIVKGLIVVVLALFSGRLATEILAIDLEAQIRRLKLEEHLSPNRRNGFFAMIEKIRTFARLSAQQR